MGVEFATTISYTYFPIVNEVGARGAVVRAQSHMEVPTALKIVAVRVPSVTPGYIDGHQNGRLTSNLKLSHSCFCVSLLVRNAELQRA